MQVEYRRREVEPGDEKSPTARSSVVYRRHMSGQMRVGLVPALEIVSCRKDRRCELHRGSRKCPTELLPGQSLVARRTWTF